MSQVHSLSGKQAFFCFLLSKIMFANFLIRYIMFFKKGTENAFGFASANDE